MLLHQESLFANKGRTLVLSQPLEDYNLIVAHRLAMPSLNFTDQNLNVLTK